MKERAEVQQLKRMGKNELLRILKECEEENRKLKEDNEAKAKKIGELENAVASLQAARQKEAAAQEPGTLADSMIQVNGVMAAAQKAAQQYLDRIRVMEDEKRLEAEAVAAEARAKAERIIAQAKAGAEQIKSASAHVLQSLQEEIDRMLSSARGEYEKKAGEEETAGIATAPAAGTGFVQQENKESAMKEKVPRVQEILDAARSTPAAAEGETAARQALPPEDQALFDEVEQFTAGLSDEIRSALDDISGKARMGQ